MESTAVRPRVPNLRWGIALLLGFGVLINYIDRVSLSVAGPSLQSELHVGPAEFGLLSSVAQLLHFSDVDSPDPKRRERYHEVYSRYKAAVAAALPLFARG